MTDSLPTLAFECHRRAASDRYPALPAPRRVGQGAGGDEVPLTDRKESRRTTAHVSAD